MVKMRAYTLLEMTTTLLVVGIVSALAYGYIASSSDKSASQPARLVASRVVAAEQAFAASRGQYTPDPDQLMALGRDLSVVSTVSTGPTVASLAVSNEDSLAVAVLGADGVCYITVLDSLASGGSASEATSEGPCTAGAHLPAGESAVSPLPVR